MIRRHELTDAGWEFVRPLLSRAGTGRPRLDDCTMWNAGRVGTPGCAGGRPAAPSTACCNALAATDRGMCGLPCDDHGLALAHGVQLSTPELADHLKCRKPHTFR
ncbi:hypothetical protein GCM10027168_30460 [Streptomyces capparidis]